MLLAALLMTAAQPPAASWTIDAQPAHCTLRSTGTSLTIESSPLDDTVDIGVPLSGRLPRQTSPASIISSPSGSVEAGEFHPAKGRRGARVQVSWPVLQRIGGDDTITIRVGKWTSAAFAGKALAASLPAMKQCNAVILDRIDYVAGATAPVPAGGYEESSEWIQDSDYPAKAIRPGSTGRVLLGWIIGNNGRIRNCTPLVPSGDPAFDTAMCRALTRRAKYPSPDSNRSGDRFGSRWIVFRP